MGSHWTSPENPCLIHECVRVKEEVFVQQRNVSCPQLEVPICPLGFQLHCETLSCCPTCRCGKTCRQASLQASQPSKKAQKGPQILAFGAA